MRAWILLAVMFVFPTCALAQAPKLVAIEKNIELCSRADSKSADNQIKGCTAIIQSNGNTPRTLAIAYNNRGNAYVTKSEYDLAIRDFDESIKADPERSKSYNNRGVAYQKKGEYDRALEDFDRSIKLESNSAVTYVSRAEALQQKGDYTRAIADYDQAIALQPKFGAAWNGRCRTRALAGDFTTALADCEEAVKLERAAVVFDTRGLIHLKMGSWDAALADYNSALRLDPSLASSLYGRGLVKLKQGGLSAGKADISKAMRLEPNVAVRFSRYGVQ
jgi:tetratricopeptide (TPR) repeat protein